MIITIARKEEILDQEKWRIRILAGVFQQNTSLALKMDFIAGCYPLGTYGFEVLQVVLEHFGLIPMESTADLERQISDLNNKKADLEDRVKDLEEELLAKDEKIKDMEQLAHDAQERVDSAIDDLRSVISNLEEEA